MRKKYRSIDQVPLIPWPSRQFSDETWMGREEQEASQKLEDLDIANRAQDGFILSLADAHRVYSLLRNPERWGIIWAGNSDAIADRTGVGTTIGFEPTWFTGDHFSALSDCMCFPRWHGTDREGKLFADYYELLNEHALFNLCDETQQFLEFYFSFDWRETGELRYR